MATMYRHSMPCAFIITVLFLVQTFVYGQVIPLKTGKKIADISFSDAGNYPLASFSLSRFAGKLIILDFWSTNCIGCIEGFPKLDSLQEKFKDQIQIILVNKSSREATELFFTKRPFLKKPRLPFIYEDTLLNKLFPHEGEPYHVWIDGNRVVRFLTDSYETSARHINEFLKGDTINLSSYSGRPVYKRSLFTDTLNKKIGYCSYIANYIKGLHIGYDMDKGSTTITENGASIVELYVRAFNEINKYHFNSPGRLLLDLPDSIFYNRPTDKNYYSDWLGKYSYYYQLIVPENKLPEKYKMMQQDLERYFNLDARIIQKKVTCLVLSRTSNDNKLKTKGLAPSFHLFQSTVTSTEIDSIRYINNLPYKRFSDCIGSFLEAALSMPFIDETGFTENIDIQFEGSVIDYMNKDNIKEALQPYDLDLVEKECWIDVLMIKEKKGK